MNTPMNQAVDAAVSEGMTVMTAAGNAGVDACDTSPASSKSAGMWPFPSLPLTKTHSLILFWVDYKSPKLHQRRSNADPFSFTIVTVGAITSQDQRVFNYGKCINVFAPGADIWSSFNTDDRSYMNLTGTSMASPHVAGLAAYLLARENLTSPEDVRDRITQLATPDKVVNAGEGSPNLIAFNGNPEGRSK